MYNQKKQIYLIGIGMGTVETLTSEARCAIEKADIIVGAERMTAPFEAMGMNCVREYRPQEVKKLLEACRDYHICAIVLSGDTGFYSGARRLAEVLDGTGEIHWIPGISSVAYLASRLGTSWEDAALVSAHGRWQNIIYTIDHNRKTFILVDRKTGERLCSKLQYYGMTEVILYIGSLLTYDNERIVKKTAEDLRPEDFQEMAVVMAENPHPDMSACPHRKDAEFIRAEGDEHVPMTKEAVRTASIAALQLTEDAVLYDVGAGTGSISIEAAGMAGNIHVYAIEKSPHACRLIEKNRRKFRADQVEIIQGTAPEVMEQVKDLKTPTHVFIGGSSGNLRDILLYVKQKNPNIRVVINAISLETLSEVMEAVKEGILPEPEIQQIVPSSARRLGVYHMMKGHNPVYIVSAGGIYTQESHVEGIEEQR